MHHMHFKCQACKKLIDGTPEEFEGRESGAQHTGIGLTTWGIVKHNAGRMLKDTAKTVTKNMQTAIKDRKIAADRKYAEALLAKQDVNKQAAIERGFKQSGVSFVSKLSKDGQTWKKK